MTGPAGRARRNKITFHHKDVVDLMGGLSKLMDDYAKRTLKEQRGMTRLTSEEQTATLDPDEVKMARAEAKELWDAIQAKDEVGTVEADIDARGLRAELKNNEAKIRARWGVRDITGEQFDDSNKFTMPRHLKAPAPPKPGTGAGGGPVPKGGLGAGGVGRGASVVEGGAAVVAGIVYGPEAVYCAYCPEACKFPGENIPMS